MTDEELISFIKNVSDNESIEEAYVLVDDLYKLFNDFSNLSYRVLHALQKFTPAVHGKTGLSNFILLEIDKHPFITRKELNKTIAKLFEHTVSRKSITDAIYTLKQQGMILSRFDKIKKDFCYRIKASGKG